MSGRWLLIVAVLGPRVLPAQVAHVATKSVVSVAAYGVLREGLHLAPVPAVVLSTLGVLAIGKTITYIQHPDWVSVDRATDITHDLLWSAALVLPLALHCRPRIAGLALMAIGGGIGLTRSWSLPRW